LDTGTIKSAGKIILHRFNGDEELALECAVITISELDNQPYLVLEAASSGSAIKTLPDTEPFGGRPIAEIYMPINKLQINNLVGTKLSLLKTYNENFGEIATNFYYFGHEPIEENEIEFLSQQDDRYLIRWTGRTADINYFGNPDTILEIEGWFKMVPPEDAYWGCTDWVETNE
jgi:hypothetical protein